MSQATILKIFIFASLFLLPATVAATGLVFDDQTWEVEVKYAEQAKIFSVRNNFDLRLKAKEILLNQASLNTAPTLDNASLGKILEVSEALNQPSKSAELVIENLRAKKFEPGQNGQILDTFALYQAILSGTDPVPLSIIISKPPVALADTNELGINELVAVGESNFAGSPANRVHNIRVGAEKYNGLVLAPGEEFGFNKFLGDVDATNGFLPELVIKQDGLKKEFGGGLCQVSTTVFRAVMNAGLPITERRNHSFAVQYYAPQGTDATIYPGVVDFRFINNLPSHLLIQTRVEGSKLYYDFYGTKDDRVVELSTPYSYDRQANGAMKSAWGRKVSINGEILEDTFYSNYRSPDLYKQESVVESNIPNPDAEKNSADETINNPEQAQ
ncbi:MAG: VanW family protein [Candidatus Doudnabacteria bacterium]|nr:VanW family protein [Candidatus Doudnabacteria bacterium]